jgi:hypothetical protein
MAGKTGLHMGAEFTELDFNSNLPDTGQRKPEPGSNPANPPGADGTAHGSGYREP